MDIHEVGTRTIFWFPEGCLGAIESQSYLVNLQEFIQQVYENLYF